MLSNSLRTRLILFLVALLGAVQITAFVLVSAASYNAARSKIEDELGVGERVFARVLKQNEAQLAQSAGVLASDFAFREAVASRDTGTLLSALENHGARIQAAAVLFVDLKGTVVADTLRPEAPRRRFELQGLIGQARDAGDAASIAMLDQRAFQVIAVPVRAPLTIGWIVVCFSIDQGLALDLQQLTGLQVSFAAEHDGLWSVLASTLTAAQAKALATRLPPLAAALSARLLDVQEQRYQTRILQLGGNDGEHIVAVLQRPIADAMASFRTLRATLLALAIISLGLSIIGSVLIALGVTRPIGALLQAVKRIRTGDYGAPVEIQRRDEIGVLAQGVEHMRAGIAEREQRILKLAYEDTLTQLPNRARFVERLQQGIGRARASERTLAILVMDLDRFKYVNDTLGHGVGDHVLREVATRLRDLCGGPDCIARLGGDEFGVLVTANESAAEPESVLALTERIIATLEQPILYEEQPIDVSASIGIAMFPDHASDTETLLRNADIAMYVAKADRSGFAIYDPHFDTTQQEHLSLLSELRRAIEQDQLQLYYQPKVTLASSSVTAAEALIRWNHPTRGLVPPAMFIPFAELTGYIKVLSRWVLEAAVRQCAAWRRDGFDIHVSVNVSARDLMSRELPEFVAELLARHDVPASSLGLEITESALMQDPALAQKVLQRLAEIGLQLSIDDYGTGYSSLSYIMRLPVNELKIDRSLVSHMAENSDQATIVRSTIELGHNLGLNVVAEGVETAEGYALLRSLGCDSVQGYFISPPLPADAFCGWIEGSVIRSRVPESLWKGMAEPDSSSVRGIG